MSLTPASSHLHTPPHTTYLKPHNRNSQASQTHRIAPNPGLRSSTLPHVASPSLSPQPTVSTQSASFGDTVTATASSSIEGWLENILQEASTSTSRHITLSSANAATQSLKRKRSLSSDCHSGHGELRRVPLKKRYLERHIAAVGSPNMSQIYQGGEDVSTESKGKSSDKTVLWGKQCMEKHRILHENANFKRYPDFQAAVRRPFEQNRHYEVRPQSVELFNFNFDYYKDGNEESFKHELLGSIIKKEFHVLRGSGENVEDPIYRPSVPRLEGIVSKYSARLRQGYLPHTYTDPSFDKKLIAKRLQEDGMHTPEPDGIWGFDPAKLPQSKFEPDTQELMTLCKKMHWPFFVMQCKLDASYDETLNQVRRDGAAIVNVALKLLRKAGYSVDGPGPNYDTYIYSMTINKLVAQWWVHWSENDIDGNRNFHMNSILPMLALEGDDLLSKLRNPTHTIIEWGLKTRMSEVKGRYAAIAQADKEAENRALQRKSGAGSSALTPGRSTSTGDKRSYSRRDSQSGQG